MLKQLVARLRPPEGDDINPHSQANPKPNSNPSPSPIPNPAEVGSTLRVVSEALGIERPLRRRAQSPLPRGGGGEAGGGEAGGGEAGGGGPLPVLYGFFTCPACDAASEARDGCAHWLG